MHITAGRIYFKTILSFQMEYQSSLPLGEHFEGAKVTSVGYFVSAPATQHDEEKGSMCIALHFDGAQLDSCRMLFMH